MNDTLGLKLGWIRIILFKWATFLREEKPWLRRVLRIAREIQIGVTSEKDVDKLDVPKERNVEKWEHKDDLHWVYHSPDLVQCESSIRMKEGFERGFVAYMNRVSVQLSEILISIESWRLPIIRFTLWDKAIWCLLNNILKEDNSCNKFG